MQTNELRLFVSSTFRDLMPEREVLVKKIFPKVRELCRQHGAYFTEIDLRWGITAEEARTGKVVRICLEEIDKCSPFFIGIMGSRYGWQPDEEVLNNDPALREDYPWLPDLIAQGKSITEIEFLHGAILRGNKDSAFIYDQIHKGEVDEEHGKHLLRLKGDISDANIPLRSFNSAEELGEQVLRDLTSILERDFPLSAEPTPLELERAPHDAFSINRRRSYVANPAYLTRFNEHVASDDPPLVIWGRSGLGKSALMAYLTYEYEASHPGSFVITHFVGAAPTGSDPEDVMRQVMLEIKHRYSLEDEIPTEEAKITEEFPFWLAKVQDEKLILAIDAVNQLTGVAEEMHWLPEFIPPHVRLIITTTPGVSLENLRKRGWQELELQPLDEAARLRIAEEYLRAYHKTLTPAQSERIAKDPKCQSPLFLRTLLEELRVFGVFEEFESHLDNYLASEDERDLFHKVLIRMEADHGEATVRDVMRAICSSRYGLSENELLEVTGIPRAYLSAFLVGLEYHLMKRSGLYTFFHTYLREAVTHRYLASESERLSSHAHLGRYFASLDASQRRSEEEPWQWIEAQEKERAIETLTNIALFPYLAKVEHHYELLTYWAKLDANDLLQASYEKFYERAKATLPRREQTDIFITLGQFLTWAQRYNSAEKPLQEAVALSEEVYQDDISKRANAIRELATVYLYQLKLTEAETSYRRAIEQYQSINDLKELSETETNLSVVYFQRGEYHKAIELQREAIMIAEKLYGKEHPVIADMLNNLAASFLRAHSYNDAEHLWIEAVNISKRTRGGVHPGTIRIELSLAALMRTLRRDSEALVIYEQALSFLLASFGQTNSLVADTYRQRSEVLSRFARFDEALTDCGLAIKIYSTIYGEDNPNTIDAYFVLADIKTKQGDLDDAYHIYKNYFPKKVSLLGVQHPRVHATAKEYIEVLEKIGRREEIENIYSQIPSLRN